MVAWLIVFGLMFAFTGGKFRTPSGNQPKSGLTGIDLPGERNPGLPAFNLAHLTLLVTRKIQSDPIYFEASKSEICRANTPNVGVGLNTLQLESPNFFEAAII
ncbi:hypothetical protein L0128_02175 [candidate division KSB1 bacterium]|nr:hypothetical protein [candidate division KSB1 bacterium]